MRLLILVILLALLPLATAQESGGIEDPLTAMRIERAKADIQEMEELGIGTAFVNDVLRDAENALLNEDYQRVLEKTEAISERKKRALEILDSMRALQLKIDEVSKIGDTSKAEEELSKANAYFKNENYGEAEDAIFEGERDLRRIEGEYSIVEARYDAARDNTVMYIKEKWRVLVLAVLLISVVGALSYIKISRMLDVKRLNDTKLERKVLDDLIVRVQKDYFNESKISRRVYDIKVRIYQEKILELDEKIPVLESQLG